MAISNLSRPDFNFRGTPRSAPGWNPYVAVLDHETIPQAVERHRRETGHRGDVTILRLPHRQHAA